MQIISGHLWTLQLQYVVFSLTFNPSIHSIYIFASYFPFCHIYSNISNRAEEWRQVLQTLQWVQDAEEIEARSGQVAKWEEYQAPGEAKQNGDSQQGTNVLLRSVTVNLPIFSGHRQSEINS